MLAPSDFCTFPRDCRGQWVQESETFSHYHCVCQFLKGHFSADRNGKVVISKFLLKSIWNLRQFNQVDLGVKMSDNTYLLNFSRDLCFLSTYFSKSFYKNQNSRILFSLSFAFRQDSTRLDWLDFIVYIWTLVDDCRKVKQIEIMYTFFTNNWLTIYKFFYYKKNKTKTKNKNKKKKEEMKEKNYIT